MEVTRTNFQEVLMELDDVLNNATFLAIDGEFTGLNSGPDASAFDTPAQYYAKLRTGSMDFLLVQLGLSVFTYNPTSDKYSQRSYNFYVFPRPFNRSTPDCRFMCQASSIAFLANQGFDFNKLFKYGIPYLTKEEEEKLNKKLEEKQKARDEEEFDLIPIPDNDKLKIEEICSKIDDFIDSEEEELTIDKCNAFIRRLVYQEVKIRWPSKIKLEGKNENGNQYLVAYKVGSDEEEKIRDAERKEKEKLEVQEAVGLSALLRKIADSGKLIVGHNMLLDLCHIINQFFGPLPESYKEFKALVHCLFPKLLDTKVVCQSSQFKDSVPSVLNHLLETIQLSPFELPETENVENKSYTLENDKLHEAGYDAYITGLCFISLCNRLGSLHKPEVSTVLADSPLLNPYMNKLLIARLKDYPHINLVGKDPNPSRDHVFHITFPKQWKISDLSQLFSPYGGAYVSWLSDTTAYAALNRRDQASSVVKNLFKSTQYSLQKYVDHQASLENEKPGKPLKSERKRKISESDSSPSPGSPTAAKQESTTTEARTRGAKGSPPTTAAAVAAAQKSQEKSQESDGWEVASGNNRAKQLELAANADDHDDSNGNKNCNGNGNGNKSNDNDDNCLEGDYDVDNDANVDDDANEDARKTSPDGFFSLVRKTRPKAGCSAASRYPQRGPAAPNGGRILASTRYTILSELDHDRADEEDEEEDERTRGAKRQGPKRSPKKSGPRRRQLVTHASEESPRRSRRSAQSRGGKTSGLAGLFTWLRILQCAGVLALVYFFTVS